MAAKQPDSLKPKEDLTGLEGAKKVVLEAQTADAIEATRDAVYTLLLAVGGSGKKAIEGLLQLMQSRGVKFGQTFELADGSYVHPDALIVDEDLTDDGNHDGESDDAELKTFQELGAHVVNLTGGQASESSLVVNHLDDEVTMPLPPKKLDPRGAGADPRRAFIDYLAVRGREDESNPLFKAKQIIDSWLTGNKNPFPAPETGLVILNGFAGGTGSILSTVLGEEIAAMMRRAMAPTKSQVSKKRFGVTGESFDLIRDGLEKKRRLNTLTGLMYLMMAYTEKKIQLTPNGEMVEDAVPGADFSFVVGGSTNYRKVAEPYEPVEDISKAAGNEVFRNNSVLGLAANNLRPRIPDLGDKGTDHGPQSILSSLGSAGLRPIQSLEELNKAKRINLFTRALGLEEVDQEIVNEKIETVFPSELLSTMMESITTAPMDVQEFGNPEELPANVEGYSSTFVNEFNKSLPENLANAVSGFYGKLSTEITGQTDAIKRTKGLNTAIEFVGGSLTVMGQVQEAIDKMTSTGSFSKDKLANIEEALRNSVATVRNTKIGTLFKQRTIEKLQKQAAQLAQEFTRYVTFLKNRALMLKVKNEILMPLKTEIRKLEESLNSEKAKATEILGKAGEFSTEFQFRRPFDVALSVDVMFSEDPTLLREEFLQEGEWTPEAMERLMENIQLKTLQDTNLLELLTEHPEVVRAIDRNSAPKALPVTGSTLSQDAIDKANRVKTIEVPIDRLDELDGIPVPKDATVVAVGETGAYTETQHIHGINPLDLDYIRKAFEDAVNLPPTIKQAVALKEKFPHEPELQTLMNREALFPWKGQIQPFFTAWSKAWANRVHAEAGHKGEVAVCTGEDCGISYHRTAGEVAAEKGNFCPCCRKLNEDKAPEKTEETAGK